MGANPHNFDPQSNTLLHYGAMTDDTEMVGYLLQLKVKTDFKNRYGLLAEQMTTSEEVRNVIIGF